MSLLYADTSALVRAYLVDEPDHETLRARLLEGDEAVVASELARVELTSAVTAAGRARRLRRPQRLLDRFDADCGPDGPLSLLRLRPEIVLPAAVELVRNHGLRTLDGIHLAVAVEEARPLAGAAGLVFVTRDAEQARVATTLGMDVT